MPAIQPPAWVGRSVAYVCLFVCPRSKRRMDRAINTELVHIVSIAVAWRALTLGSKGQRSRSQGYQVHPAWVRTSIRLPMFCSFFSFLVPCVRALD